MRAVAVLQATLTIALPLVGSSGATALIAAQELRAPKWMAPPASLLVPGSGQLLQKRERGAIYLVAEIFLVAHYMAAHREAERESEAYKDLAFYVARGPFGPSTRDTSFAYFEHMERFIESGPFDDDPGVAFQPPVDEQTYNGSIWALARRTFFANPDSIPPPESLEYQQAVEFYRRRAVGDNFRWSWRNAGLEHDLFRQAIRRSDQAAKRATQYLGLALANHLLSAVDAFVSERLLGHGTGAGTDLAVHSLLWSPGRAGQIRGLVWLQMRF